MTPPYRTRQEVDNALAVLSDVASGVPVKEGEDWIKTKAAKTVIGISQDWQLDYLLPHLRRRWKGKGYEYHPDDVRELAAKKARNELYIPKKRP